MAEEKNDSSGPVIDRSNYPGNSYKGKDHKKEEKPSEEDSPRVEKLVTSEVTQKKRGFFSRVKDTMSGDDAQSVGSYILYDIAIPAFKNLVADAVSQGIERILFGTSTARPSAKKGSGGYTSYNTIYKNNSPDPYERVSRRNRAVHEFDDIVIESRVEADRVIDTLQLLIQDYDVARVSDLYDLVGITGTFTDNKWGWTNLSSARVNRARNGYLLSLPRPEPLN